LIPGAVQAVTLGALISLAAVQIHPGSAQSSRRALEGGQPVGEVDLNRSVAQLVADGWKVVGVSQAGPILAYHLVQGGKLAICYLNLAETPMNSSCHQLTTAS
jgi:hypothetical protein